MIAISECIKNYKQGWKREVKGFSPKLWGFVSFILPLMAVPLAIKGVTYVAKEVKKAMDKKK